MKNYFSGLMGLLIALLIASACKKNEEHPVVNGNVTSVWECMATDGTESGYFYLLNVSQVATILSGEVTVRDDTLMKTGLISGSLNGGNLQLECFFVEEYLSFHFTSTISTGTTPQVINGKITRNSPGSIVEFDASLVKSAKIKCDSLLIPNPYYFRRVHAAVNPTAPPVIFIHGMAAHMKCWDTLISHLPATFMEKHDIYLFQYNWKDSIMINGRILRDSVLAAGLTDPILIGHSMGGLVSRAYIVSGGAITKLVSLGTPHLGTPLVDLINLFCFVNFPGPRNMYPDEGFIPMLLHHPLDIANRTKYEVIEGQMTGQHISGLNWQWNPSWANIVDKLGYETFSIFGTPPNDGLVPVSSASFDTLGAPVNRPLPVQQWVDHFNLIQPSKASQILEYISSL